MMPDKVESIFDQAICKGSDERSVFLDQACGGDLALRKQIERLIEAHENPDGFLEFGPHERDQLADTSPLRASMAGIRIDKYKLLQQIGEGGFGVVFMAEQESPVQRKVAVKIIKPGMDTHSVVARFEAERQALAMMDHPNIAKVFDGGAIDVNGGHGIGAAERPYFVMELVKGVPITEYCDKNALSTRERLTLFIDVCHAMRHAHQKGIIHRDIKPSNVMITLHDGKPVVKIIDFGIAKAVHQKLTERTMFTEYGQMIGTPQYMSPEQAELSGLDVDTRSDVYSLGVLLYELLTGTTPLEANQIRAAGYAEMQRMIREDLPPKPSQRLSTVGEALMMIAKHRSVSPDGLHREIKGDLDWIVMKGLEKDRQRRYESASGLAEDIQRHLAHQPVSAGPPSLVYRAQKFARRNSRSLAGATAALFVLLVFAAWFTSQWAQDQSKQAAATKVLAGAIESASLDLGRAVSSPIGDETDWVAARSSRKRIADLLETATADPDIQQQAQSLLMQIDEADDDRQLASSVEEVIINSATHEDRESWTRMEQQLRDVFRARSIDFDELEPSEVADRIRAHKSANRLVDALELWIATRGQLMMLGGPQLGAADMQPWAEAIYAADADPLRTGIRRLIYERRPFEKEDVERLVKGIQLETRTPRTLSWLAIVFLMAGDVPRSEEVNQIALRTYPNDLMLNFDYALSLEKQGDAERAIRYYMRCTALRPDVAGLWRGLGNTLRKNNELAASQDALQRSVELQPGHAPTLADLAETQLALENVESAKENAQHAVNLRPENARAYGLLGRALMGASQFDEALVALQTALALQGNRKPQLPIEDWLTECETRIGATNATSNEDHSSNHE